MSFFLRLFLAALAVTILTGASIFTRKPITGSGRIVVIGDLLLGVEKTPELEASIAGGGDALMAPMSVGFLLSGVTDAALLASKVFVSENTVSFSVDDSLTVTVPKDLDSEVVIAATGDAETTVAKPLDTEPTIDTTSDADLTVV